MIDHQSQGTTGYEERLARTDGAWAVLHRAVAPSAEIIWQPSERGHPPPAEALPLDGAVRRRVFASAAIPAGGSVLDARVPLLFNDDVTLHWVTASGDAEDTEVWSNADGDEFACVVSGSGRVESPFGALRFHGAEYVWIPRGIPHRWRLDPGGARLLLVEARGELRVPPRYRNALGQLLLPGDGGGGGAPYGHRDFARPVWVARAANARGSWRHVHKRRGAFWETRLDRDPLAVVGWDGVVHPVALPWETAVLHAASDRRQDRDVVLFEHPGFTLATHVAADNPAAATLGDDTVTLGVDEDGAGVLLYDPGCVPHRRNPGRDPGRGAGPDGGRAAGAGSLALTLRALHPLRLTPNAVALAR